MDTLPTIVVGGGLAGLAAAATLARDGRRVVVIEGASQLGGRARTRHHDGFDLNLGPHALYIGGGASAVLRDLGVGAPGRRPRLHRSGVLAGEQVVPAMRFLQREVRQRRRLMGLITGRGRGGADRLAGVTASEWIRDTLSDPGALAVAASLLRTATYSADRDLLDAGAAAMQLRAATTRGVRYIDGGWTTLVRGLAVQVRRHGGEIRTGVAAAAVEHDDQVHAVRLADGTTLPAAGVVVAVNDPRQALGLLDGPAAARLADAVDDMVPLRMAHLDVALRPLPAAAHPNILGIDRPVYLTVQSDVARVAPEGGAITAPNSSTCSTSHSRVGAITSSTSATCRGRSSAATTLARPRWARGAVWLPARRACGGSPSPATGSARAACSPTPRCGRARMPQPS
jgi:phytoene dehydrogenase-like protein